MSEQLPPEGEVHATLKQYWGYTSFRPLQEQIVRSILAHRDACVVMPTGGGKSLCYQLPALMMEGTAVVISPLLALMKDQVAQLSQMGVPAGMLNSTLTSQEQTEVMRKAGQGAYRMLYLSPERLARQDTINWLHRLPISLFVIDEAHCISEWGHEFRPEYRQLSALRHNFPDVPIAAFTASATRPVRHDILQQLRLDRPACYIRSFHRGNLRYIVRETDMRNQNRLLLDALKAHDGSSVIIYAPTIQRVYDTVDMLQAKRIPAIPYHGQMESKERESNQERWMSDEVRVLVGTLAFGLGINKPGVRAVIHLSLPKSLEQYYQEAGRAGRDGDPADCLMLWQKRDKGLLAHFIQQLQDKQERERAWERYRVMTDFVTQDTCRHLAICQHFGETPKWERCEVCDVCGNVPEWLSADAPAAAAAPTRRAARATKMTAAAAAQQADPALVEYLREWRRDVAKAAGTPTFLVLTDASLIDLAAREPDDLEELLQVQGIGQRKAEQYGREILAALARFHQGARANTAVRATSLLTPAEETKALLEQGHTFAEIAQIRMRTLQTIVETVARLVETGEVAFRGEWVATGHLELIRQAVERHGDTKLKAIKDALPAAVTYDEIKLVAALWRKQRAAAEGR